MSTVIKLAVAGAGLIGQRHAEAIAMSKSASLACIVDPAQAGADFAKKHNAKYYKTLDEMIVKGDVDGVILATPNQLHEEGAIACINAGLPVLIEKPISTNVASAQRIVDASQAANVMAAVGHHRRHNPLIAKAKSLIDSGSLGQISSVQVTTWFMKPDDYFDAEWRTKKGAGPVYLNLIHDLDLLLHLVGPVETVQAMESNTVRGNEVEETAVINLRFKNGALGTVNVSDTIVAPYSWELTARENPAYPANPQDCYLLGGTKGSLSLPNLVLWQNQGKRSWWEPLSATRYPFDLTDPLILQVEQFSQAIQNNTPPLVSAKDGMAALIVIEAIKQAAASGQMIELKE